MWGPETWMGVINGLGTIAMTAFLIDRVYRLMRLWILVRDRVDVYGPKPIILTTLHASSAEARTILRQEGSTG
jgi:hypothetical protein